MKNLKKRRGGGGKEGEGGKGRIYKERELGLRQNREGERSM